MREWKKDERMLHSGECLWLGDVIVAHVTWKSGVRDKPETSGPRCHMGLPGIAAKDLPHRLNPLACAHPHESQTVQVNHALKEIIHSCGLCGEITTQTLGLVATKPLNDLWQAVLADGPRTAQESR